MNDDARQFDGIALDGHHVGAMIDEDRLRSIGSSGFFAGSPRNHEVIRAANHRHFAPHGSGVRQKCVHFVPCTPRVLLHLCHELPDGFRGGFWVEEKRPSDSLVDIQPLEAAIERRHEECPRMSTRHAHAIGLHPRDGRGCDQHRMSDLGPRRQELGDQSTHRVANDHFHGRHDFEGSLRILDVVLDTSFLERIVTTTLSVPSQVEGCARHPCIAQGLHQGLPYLGRLRTAMDEQNFGAISRHRDGESWHPPGFDIHHRGNG